MAAIWHLCKLTYAQARRVMIALAGFTVVLIGLAMLILPGPGLVVIPIGLAILAVEFAFARAWLAQLKEHTSRAAAYVRSNVNSRSTPIRPKHGCATGSS
jgi:tellurite resistance protein TerC